MGSTFPCACPSSREEEGGIEMYFFTSSNNAKQV
jgi:hypothetical protein